MRTIGAQVTVRGFTESAWYRDAPKLDRAVAKGIEAVDWNPFAVDTRWDTQQLGSGAVHTYPEVTVLVNRTDAAASVRDVLTRAEQMFAAGAYWHWYKQCGCEEQDMLEAFEQARCIVANYDAT